MRWIGLTGKAGAGKDHLCAALYQLDQRVVRIGFADALKAEISFKLNPSDAFLFYRKPYSDEVRQLLQWWGTDLRRKDDPEYWTKKTEIFAQKQTSLDRLPVFSDVRFPNEADMIRRNGGLIVRVNANQEVRQRRLGALPPDHPSETAMDEYPVDMNVLSIEENETYDGQVRRVLVMATIDDVVERIQDAIRG